MNALPSPTVFTLVLLAVWSAARPSAASPPCQDHPDAQYGRLSAVSDVLHVPPSPARLAVIIAFMVLATIRFVVKAMRADRAPTRVDPPRSDRAHAPPSGPRPPDPG